MTAKKKSRLRLTRRRAGLGVLLALGLMAAPLRADLDASTRVARLLLKSLKYDRNLAARAGDRLDLAVLMDPGRPSSMREGAELQRAFQLAAAREGHAGQVLISLLVYESGASLRRQLEARDIDALYVTTALEPQIETIRAATRTAWVRSLCGSRAGVKAGLTIGAVVVDRRPHLYVNVEASVAEGMQLQSGFLSLVEIVR